MSQILGSILAELGPDTLSQLGASVGASPTQTQNAVAAALPALVAGLAKNTAQPAGAHALASALDRDHGPNLVDTLGPLAGLLGGGGGQGGAGGLLGGVISAATGGGNGGGGLGALLSALATGAAGPAAPRAANGAGILGHILGDQQGAVVKKVSEASGLPPGTVATLLPALAPVLMSALGTIKAKNGLDAGGVAQLVQAEHKTLSGPAAKAAAPGALDLGAIGGALMQSGLLGQLFGAR